MSVVEMDRTSASRGADSAFGAAAISLSMAALRWCMSGRYAMRTRR